MNCQEFESTLNTLLDHRENPRGNNALLAHSSECEFCANSLELYAAMGEYTEKVRPKIRSAQSLNAKRRFTSYVAAVTAAAVLLLLLSPLGGFFANQQGGQVNIARAKATPTVEKDSQKLGTTPNSQLNPEFWQDRQLSKMVPLEDIKFQVPQVPNFEEVGQSMNSVWKSIKEDEFLLPIIKQGALFWMPKV